jgi:hypothetical protein
VNFESPLRNLHIFKEILQYPVLPNHSLEYHSDQAVRDGGYACNFPMANEKFFSPTHVPMGSRSGMISFHHHVRVTAPLFLCTLAAVGIGRTALSF